MSKKRRLFAFFCIFLGGQGGEAIQAIASVASSMDVFWVDKSRHELHHLLLSSGGLPPQFQKTYRVVLGKSVGDKEQENDLKTPEGIYFLSAIQKPTSSAAREKLGTLGMRLNFPNPVDRWHGKTGFGILIHGVNEPSRFDKKNDTEGCVALANEDVLELQKVVRLKKTPTLIFSDLTPEWRQGGEDPSLTEAFQSWVRAWEGQDLETYLGRYHPDFISQGKNLEQWRKHKARLNQIYGKIEVRPEDVFYLRHPKYAVILFRQQYRSFLRAQPERMGYQSQGTKVLYAVQDELKRWRWLAESFLEGV